MTLPVAILGGGLTTWNHTDTNTVHTIASVTGVQLNDVLILSVSNVVLAPANFFTVVSVVGGGLTWQKYAAADVPDGVYFEVNPATTHGGMRAEMWWAPVLSAPGGPFALTVTMSGQPGRGGMFVGRFTGCLNPAAPWDTHASLPAILAVQSRVGTLTYSATNHHVLPVMVYCESAASGSGGGIAATAGWTTTGGFGITFGGYGNIDNDIRYKPPRLPTPAIPNAYGCDPRTATSMTMTWDAVPPSDYTPTTNATAVNTAGSPSQGCVIMLLGCLVGPVTFGTITYDVLYYRESDWTGGTRVVTAATQIVATDLIPGDFHWHVTTRDSVAGQSVDASPYILCPWYVPPPPFLSMDDVVCIEGGDAVAPALDSNLISLRWSDDGGHRFGHPISQNIGNVGGYLASIQWQRLGFARHRVWELSWTVSCNAALVGAWIDPIPGKS